MLYDWDVNGNLLNDGVNDYDYDPANRLVSFSNPSTLTTITYDYNGLGDRLRQTVNGQTTSFTMDLNTGLTQALSDGTNNYIYGKGRIAQTQGGATEYFLNDSLSSVRQITDANAQITYARAYDPYGVASTASGSSQSAYGYTGEYSEDATDLLYLRARFYAPGTGRFLTKDPSGLETNPYWYATANPINRIDPTGLFSKEILAKNHFDLDNFTAMPDDWTHHRHWGFYLLLRNAQSGDSIRVGAVSFGNTPDVLWKAPETIYLANCDLILVGSKPLEQYYENQVASRDMPLVWWRDTSAMYYELTSGNQPPRYAVDGSDNNMLDYPNFTGISFGLGIIEVGYLTDSYGNHYYSFSGGGGGVLGLSYMEGYMCDSGSCSKPSSSEIEQTLSGICFGGEAVVIPTWDSRVAALTGLSAAVCPAYQNSQLNFSSVSTYYLGWEIAGGGGVTLTVPSGDPPNPEQGWRWAITDRLNGATYNKLIAWEIQ